MRNHILVPVLTLLAAAGARADYSAEYFEKGSGRSKKIFTSEHKFTPQGEGELLTSTYKGPEGEILYVERVTLSGSRIQKLEVEQKQLNQTALVEVKDGKIHFTKTTEGKTRTSDEKLGDSFVMSGNFQRFVRDNWAALSSGKKVDFRFGVWDRMETIGFRLQKEGEEEIQGEKAVVLKLKPSSVLIAALVDPLLFKFSADGSRLMEMTGRVPVKKASGSSFKDQDAEAVYAY